MTNTIRTPLVITVATVVAVSSVLPSLHELEVGNCEPSVELCSPPEVGYLPDEQEKEHAPLPTLGITSLTAVNSTPIMAASNLRAGWSQPSERPRWRDLNAYDADVSS
jgi:hypothetical protein